MEIFNEFTFLIVSYSYILFTDYNLSTEIKIAMGWCLIGITLLNIGLNYIVVIYKTFY